MLLLHSVGIYLQLVKWGLLGFLNEGTTTIVFLASEIMLLELPRTFYSQTPFSYQTQIILYQEGLRNNIKIVSWNWLWLQRFGNYQCTAKLPLIRDKYKFIFHRSSVCFYKQKVTWNLHKSDSVKTISYMHKSREGGKKVLLEMPREEASSPPSPHSLFERGL